jgi:hypothetical protein
VLAITLGAKARLTSKLTGKKAADGEAMRFTRRTGGWTLKVDRQCPTDTVILHEGRIVLLLDTDVSQAMKDMTLDVKATGAGPRLTLR